MSMNLADLYGGPSAATPRPDLVTTGGPNQGAVAAPGSSNAPAAGTGAAFSWIGFGLVLLALRVIIETSGRKQGNLV